MRHLLTLILLFIFSFAFSQSPIKIQPSDSSNITVANILRSLVGEGIVIRNFTANRLIYSQAFGSFEDESNTLGLSKGIMMTTGSVQNVAGKNNQGNMSYSGDAKVKPSNIINHRRKEKGRISDADLEQLLGNTVETYDACVVEMDIIPVGDTLAFSYVFASEEYDEYVCSQFNDIFAFFISGKGINGKRNVALLPGSSTPVSINNVNNGNQGKQNCIPSNPTFYKRNTGELIEYDGFTRVLEIKQPVVPFETYHLKLAIADVADNAYDSGVLIESKSVISYHNSFSIPFEYNSYLLTDNARKVLDDLVKEMKEHNSEKILLSGHTDSDGSEEYNLWLAKKRLESTISYLESVGVSSEDIVIKNRGEGMPIENNYTDNGKAANRRVDIKLLADADRYTTYKTEILGQPEMEATLKTVISNPFSNSTRVILNIPTNTGDAKLVVSDLTGKMVKQIGIMETGYSEHIIGEGLHAGSYFVTLITNGKVSGNTQVVKSR